MSSQVVILSLGRTGSSMLAQILRKLGVFMGYVFQRADDANPLGFWEDVAFQHWNERMIASLPAPLPIFRTELAIHGDMMNLVESRDEEHELWSWKNTHTALAITLWDSLLSNPRYIWLDRDREEIAESHFRAWGVDKQLVRENYDIYTGAIKAFLQDREYLYLTYDNLLATQNVEQIAAFLGVKGDVEQARKVIMPELRHIYKEPMSHET